MEIDIKKIREEGYRPQAVGCFVSRKKIFIFYDEKWKIWQIPQGGIEKGETMKEGLKREMIEELGERFFSQARNISFLGEDVIDFPKETRKNLSKKVDSKEELKGKKYFFFLIRTDEKEIEIGETEFDQYRLVGYDEADELADQIYQKGKRRTTKRILGRLKNKGIIE